MIQFSISFDAWACILSTAVQRTSLNNQRTPFHKEAKITRIRMRKTDGCHARWGVSSISGQRFAGSNMGECLQSVVATWMWLMFSCVAILSLARQGGTRSTTTYTLVFPEHYSGYYSSAICLCKQLTLLSTKFYLFPFLSLLALSCICLSFCPSAPTGWFSMKFDICIFF